jgi:hypothetical protein
MIRTGIDSTTVGIILWSKRLTRCGTHPAAGVARRRGCTVGPASYGGRRGADRCGVAGSQLTPRIGVDRGLIVRIVVNTL